MRRVCRWGNSLLRVGVFLLLASISAPSGAEIADNSPAAFAPDPSPKDTWEQQRRATLITGPNDVLEPARPASDEACLSDCPRGSIALQQGNRTDHAPSGVSTHRGFWKQAGTVKTESLLLLGAFTLAGANKLREDTSGFHLKNEHWFSKDSEYLGVDKLAHAFNTYLIAEVLHDRVHRRTNASEGDALTAAAMAVGLMTFNELSDGIEPESGFSFQDVAMNLVGAGFSVLRNTVPGLKEKLSYKLQVEPNSEVYTFGGEKHFQQERFMLSIKGAGFEQLKQTPLRFLDLQLGYYGSNFLEKDRLAGIEPQRHLFVGLGLNAGELFFSRSRSRAGRSAYTALDYIQPPYTTVRYDSTGRFGH